MSARPKCTHAVACLNGHSSCMWHCTTNQAEQHLEEERRQHALQRIVGHQQESHLRGGTATTQLDRQTPRTSHDACVAIPKANLGGLSTQRKRLPYWYTRGMGDTSPWTAQRTCG